MARELQVSLGKTGASVYAVIRNETSGFVWSTSGGVSGAFEAFASGNWANYALGLVEQGISAYYLGNWPTAMGPGIYAVEAREQLGGTPAQTDPRVAGNDQNWNGSGLMPLSDVVTSGQFSAIGQRIEIARGRMVRNYGIYLKSAADHITPLVSGSVSGQIAKDNGTFGALQSGAFTETGLGWYNLQALTSGDLDCDSAKLLFTAVGISGGASDPLPISIILQRSGGG